MKSALRTGPASSCDSRFSSARTKLPNFESYSRCSSGPRHISCQATSAVSSTTWNGTFIPVWRRNTVRRISCRETISRKASCSRAGDHRPLHRHQARRAHGPVTALPADSPGEFLLWREPEPRARLFLHSLTPFLCRRRAKRRPHIVTCACGSRARADYCQPTVFYRRAGPGQRPAPGHPVPPQSFAAQQTDRERAP